MFMSPPTRSVVLLALTTALCACTTVGPQFERPPAPSASAYAAPGDTAPARAALSPEARPAGVCWDALGSADLDRVIREALKDSPTLAEADAVLARNRAQADAVAGTLKPQAD